MRLLYVFFALAIGLVLMGCGGSTDMLEDGRSVSTTVTISGIALEEGTWEPVVGVMGLWDVTSGMNDDPDYTQELDGQGEFAFTSLPAGNDYYIAVWQHAHEFEGWNTSRNPYLSNLNTNIYITFWGYMP